MACTPWRNTHARSGASISRKTSRICYLLQQFRNALECLPYFLPCFMCRSGLALRACATWLAHHGETLIPSPSLPTPICPCTLRATGRSGCWHLLCIDIPSSFVPILVFRDLGRPLSCSFPNSLRSCRKSVVQASETAFCLRIIQGYPNRDFVALTRGPESCERLTDICRRTHMFFFGNPLL